MSYLQEEARLIHDELPKEPGIDPITIIMLISLLVNVIRLILECRENAKGVKGLLQRKYVRRQIDRITSSTLPPKEYILYGADINKALYKRGLEIEEKRLQTILENGVYDESL
jgi:hypothetical protein